MKLQLNAGDWATIAFFALAVALGVFSELKRGPSARSTTSAATANHSSSGRTAVAAVGLE